MNRTVYISNLPLSIDSSELEDMFTTVGDVHLAQVELDPLSGASLGRGSVEMSTRESAENCVLYFNRQAVNGYRLSVDLKDPGTRSLRPLKRSTRTSARRKPRSIR